jgi:hypothetical protein
MRTPCLVILAICLTAVPAAAKPKNCFSLPEIAAEREIRHGIYMREAARRCDTEYVKGLAALWQKFETANGAKFKAANAKRLKGWEREFPDDWKAKVTHADGRLVTYARNIPRTQGFCENMDEQLQELDKRGYAAFSKQSRRVHNEVIGDYKVCQ